MKRTILTSIEQVRKMISEAMESLKNYIDSSLVDKGNINVDKELTPDGENPVRSKGIWNAIWGVLTTPTTSIYEWVSGELAKKQNTLKQGDNITIEEDGTISAAVGDVNLDGYAKIEEVAQLLESKADSSDLQEEVDRAIREESKLEERIAELEAGSGGGGGGGGEGSSIIVSSVLTPDGENPVKSKGIWRAIWGAISAPAASVYAWVMTELGKKQDTLSDTQLAAVNSGITAAKVEKLNGVEAGAQKNPDLSGYAKTAEVETALEGKQNTLTAGENITIENGVISASGGGGDIDVVAEIEGRVITPSAVIKSNNIRTVGSSAESPFYIYEKTSATSKSCSLEMGLSDVSWCINAEEIDESYGSGNYSGSVINLLRENFKTGDTRSLEISVRNGTIHYAGPEGEAEKSIFDWINGGGGGDEGGISQMMVETTWEDLVSMRDNGELIAGMQYRITDYVATTVQEHTQSANHPFDIIVTADSPDKLNEVARAIRHDGDNYFPETTKFEAWKIWYSLDNDTNRFEWADEENGKGVIYRMIDEFDNDFPYDFKGILMNSFILNTLGGIQYNSDFWYGLNFFRLNVNRDASLHGNSFSAYANTVLSCIDEASSKFVLPFVMFNGTGNHNNKIGFRCKNLLFGRACAFNTIEDDCDSNIFGDEVSYNYLGCQCTRNKFGDFSQEIILGAKCVNNTFVSNCFSIIMGNKCQSNKFNDSCFSIRIGDNCSSNVFDEMVMESSLEMSCNFNNIGCFSCYVNCGTHCDNIVLGGECLNVDIGAGCYSIKAEFPLCLTEIKQGLRNINLEPTEENGYEDPEKLTIIEQQNSVTVKV